MTMLPSQEKDENSASVFSLSGMEVDAVTSAGQRAFLFSILVNILLFIIKMIGSWLGHSEALMADGLDTFSDILKTVILAWAFTYSRRPPDEDHPYGHGKADPMAAGISGLVIFLLAGGIIVRAVGELIEGSAERPNWIALAAACVSIVAKEVLFQSNVRVGRRIGSEALVADAWNFRMDVISSVAAVVGIGLVLLFGETFWFADNAAAIAVSLLMMRVAFDIYKNSAGQLMDACPSEEIIAEVRSIALQTPGVCTVPAVKIRRMGTRQTADLKIEVDGRISVEEGHDIATEVRARIQIELPAMVDVFVHVEPEGHNRRKNA